MFLGDVVDQLHQNNRFADAGTAEQADFTAARIGGEQIDDFYAGLKRLNLGFLIDEFWRRPVNWRKLLRIDWSTFIHRLADHVDDPSESSLAHRHADTCASIHNIHAAHQTFSGIHGDTAHRVLTQVLRHLDHQIPLGVTDRGVGNLERVVNRRQPAAGKLDVDDRTQNLGEFTHTHRIKTSEIPVRGSCSKIRVSGLYRHEDESRLRLLFQCFGRTDDFQ